jgi:hypothetical protein
MLVEPFRESDPGPHVIAAIDAARAAGLEVDMDALATVVSGPIDELAVATATIIREAFQHGATAIQLHVEGERTGEHDSGGT